MSNPSPRPPSSSPVKISHRVLPSQDLPLRGPQCQGPPQRPPSSVLPSKPSGRPTIKPTPSAESAARTSRFRVPVESLIKVAANVVVGMSSECHRCVTKPVEVMSSRCRWCVIKVVNVNVVASVIVTESSGCHQCVITVVNVAWSGNTAQVTNVTKLVEAKFGFAKLTGGLSRMPEAKPARNLQRKNSDAAAPGPTSTA